MADQDPIIIIGAGIGGLSTAIYLAAKKRKVLIFEKNETIGGRLGEFQKGGFHWDIGPSWISNKSVVDDIFQVAKKRSQDSLQFLPVEPLARYHFQDGKSIDYWNKTERNLEIVTALDIKDKPGYLKYLSFSKKQYQIVDSFITSGLSPTFNNFLRTGLGYLFAIDWFRNLDTAIQDQVRSSYLREILRYSAMEIGSNPYQAPGYLSYLHHQIFSGLWYLRGGMFILAQVLQRLAIELGVKIFTKSPVAEILTRDKEIRGILLESGKWYEVDTVVSNLDAATVYKAMLPKKPPYTWEFENLDKLPLSPATFTMLLGVKAQYEGIKVHNVFFSGDTKKELEQIFKLKLLPDDPTVIVDVTSKNIMHHAPHGSENWKVTVNVPADAEYDWSSRASEYRNIVLSALARHGYDISDHIVEEKIITPLDIENKTGTYRGSLHGAAILDWMGPFRRPKPQPVLPGGLYFVGSSTFPGGGPEMSILSGKFVANILAGN